TARGIVDMIGRVSGEENLPRKWQMIGIDARIDQDDIGAVGRQRVVELRVLPELIDGPHVLQEYPATVFDGRADPEQIDILGWVLPVVRPEANHVSLVADDIDQLILSEESAERRISFPALLAGFD